MFFVRSRSNWNLELLVFYERGKLEYPERNLSKQELKVEFGLRNANS